MNNKKKPLFLGLNKAASCANYCIFDPSKETVSEQLQIILAERFLRKKRSADPLFRTALQQIDWSGSTKYQVAESSYGESPEHLEKIWGRVWPLAKTLKDRKAPLLSGPKNLQVSHHEAHAWAAAHTAPFSEAVVIVFDGDGHNARTLQRLGLPKKFLPDEELHLHIENFSIFILKNSRLTLVEKKYQKFIKAGRRYDQFENPGFGQMFEYCSAYVFGDKDAAGKLMGLAPYGKATPYASFEEFLSSLDWARSNKNYKFEKRDRQFRHFSDIAASAQGLFERKFLEKLKTIKKSHSDIENLILTGGCALNCVNNSKILKSQTFRRVYVPPAPGDESIAHGVAIRNAVHQRKYKLNPVRDDQQTSFLGRNTNVDPALRASRIRELFRNYDSSTCVDLPERVSQIIAAGETVAVFRGRSETGPRSLGHRSILANPLVSGMRHFLNQKIKFREWFRPYGCSVNIEKMRDYFEVEKDFRSDFMSFAPMVRAPYRKILGAIMSPDGRSRIQTVTKEQDEFLHRLIRSFGDKSGFYVLLHTSLNTMGEPIVESYEEAAAFFKKSLIRHMVVEDFLISKKK